MDKREKMKEEAVSRLKNLTSSLNLKMCIRDRIAAVLFLRKKEQRESMRMNLRTYRKV